MCDGCVWHRDLDRVPLRFVLLGKSHDCTRLSPTTGQGQADRRENQSNVQGRQTEPTDTGRQDRVGQIGWIDDGKSVTAIKPRELSNIQAVAVSEKSTRRAYKGLQH